MFSIPFVRYFQTPSLSECLQLKGYSLEGPSTYAPSKVVVFLPIISCLFSNQFMLVKMLTVVISIVLNEKIQKKSFYENWVIHQKDPIHQKEVRLQNNTAAKLSISKENKKTGRQVLEGFLHPGFEVCKFSNHLGRKKKRTSKFQLHHEQHVITHVM